MSWRCQECDYLGEEIVENELTDEGCPECGGDCIEIRLMTVEQDEMLEQFFEVNIDYFLSPYGADEYVNEDNYGRCFLWEDFKVAKELANSRKDIFIYTVIEGDCETAWITEGWHFVNRIGYFFTTRKIDIPEEDLRYW